VFAPEIRRDLLAEPEAVHPPNHTLRAYPLTGFDRANVAGLDDDILEREHAIGVHVIDSTVRNTNEPRGAVDQIGGPQYSLLESGAGADELEGRTRFVRVLNGAIATLLGRGVAVFVRVERGITGHRQDFPVPGIHDDHAATCRVVLEYSGAEFTFRDVLQVAVQSDFEVVARGRRPFDPSGNGSLQPVGLQQHQAVAAADSGIEGRLETSQPSIVPADITECRCGKQSVRVVAAALLRKADALDLQRSNTPRHLVGDVPFDEMELLPGGQGRGERLLTRGIAAIERPADEPCRLARILDQAGIRDH
jgi:hypothetical protein